MRYVKCCFLIDATASMGPYIASAKRQARNIMTTLKQENPNSNFLFGAVFYRDFGDTPQFHIVDFQEDITHDIQYVDAFGGDDVPEDVAGGYQKVLEMDWRFAEVKFCFHIADAPPHGRMWHEPHVEDNHPFPVGRQLEEILDDMHRHDILLSIIRVNSSIDIMIRNIQRIYRDELHVIELDHQSDNPVESVFTESITRHISSTLQMEEDPLPPHRDTPEVDALAEDRVNMYFTRTLSLMD